MLPDQVSQSQAIHRTSGGQLLVFRCAELADFRWTSFRRNHILKRNQPPEDVKKIEQRNINKYTKY